MSEKTLIIPFYSVDKIVESKPTKVVFKEGYMELFGWHKLLEENEDKGIKEQVLYDFQTSVIKNHITCYEYGMHVNSELYGFIIRFGDAKHILSFPTRSAAKEFYIEFQNWYNTK